MRCACEGKKNTTREIPVEDYVKRGVGNGRVRYSAFRRILLEEGLTSAVGNLES